MIGLDISEKSIKIVRLANDSSRRLLSHCAEALPDGVLENGLVVKPEVLAKIVDKVLDKCGVSRSADATIASISETQSFLRVIEIPEMHEDEINEAVKWEVAQHIPFGLENVYIDWQPLEAGHKPSTGRQEVQVGAAQKKVIDALYAALRNLDLDIAAFELESQAITRALISSDLLNRQGLLIVDLGASATNVIIHDHGAMRFTASLQKGVQHVSKGQSKKTVETVDTKLHTLTTVEADDLGAVLMPSIDALVLEVKGVVEFYNSIDAQHEVREIMLTGGGSNLPALDKAFLQHFDSVHVQRGNPWVNIISGSKNITPPMDIAESVRYTTAIGLALRPALL